MSIDGDGFHSIQYQNANNSVRVTEEFMRAVESDGDWHLTARTTGQPIGKPVMPTQLIDMDTLEGKPIEGAVALPIELLGDPCIRILLKKAIHGRQGLWSG